MAYVITESDEDKFDREINSRNLDHRERTS